MENGYAHLSKDSKEKLIKWQTELLNNARKKVSDNTLALARKGEYDKISPSQRKAVETYLWHERIVKSIKK